jgi:hypothetical protein
MSRIFGPVIQQGYVVPDIERAISHWLARGIGPFFLEEHIRPPGEYDGEPIQADLSAAFAYSGDQQIEVIEQHDDVRTIYRDFLKGHPTGGLHHLAVWVDSIPEKLSELSAAGYQYRVRQRYGDAHAYLDSVTQPGVMIQLMARIELMTGLFEVIEGAARDWDGETDPVRRIDWSSGSPRVEPPK